MDEPEVWPIPVKREDLRDVINRLEPWLEQEEAAKAQRAELRKAYKEIIRLIMWKGKHYGLTDGERRKLGAALIGLDKMKKPKRVPHP